MAAALLSSLVMVLAAQTSAVDAGAFSSDAGVPAPDAQSDAVAVAAPLPAPALGVVRGRVQGRGSREPMQGATLTVGLDAVGETDDDGRFDLTLPAGHHRLQIQQPGFDPLDVEVDVRANETTTLRTLRLEPRLTGERYETVVTAPDQQAPRTALRGDELVRTPGSFGDPLRVIESLPGVSQVVWPLALYTIRGSNPGNTGFLIDGARLPALYHFALGPSVIHPYFIEQVDFYPGGYPARYGRFVGGVVAAKTSSPKVDRTHGSVDVRLFDAGGIVITPIDNNRGSVAVAGRMSYIGAIFSALSPDYTFNYWDYQVRVEHTLGPGKLTLFSFGAGDRLGRKTVSTDDAQLDFHRLDLRWQGTVAGGRLWAGALAGYDRSATSIKTLVANPISVRTLSTSGRVGWSRRLASWADIEIGGDTELQRFRPRSLLTVAQEQDLFRDRTAILSGAYVAAPLGTGTRLLVTPGLRYDLFSEDSTHKHEIGPRLQVRYRVAGDVWLKGSGGRFVQAASLPVTVPGFENFGLGQFGTQWSWQSSTGVEAPLGGGLTLDATGFYQRFKLTDLDSVFNYDPQLKLLELRDGQSYGVEVMVRRSQAQRFYGWLSYTLSWSERVVGDYKVRAPSDWDQRHILNLVTGYRLGGGITLGARFHYNTGRPYPVFDARTVGIEYTRLPAFYQLDLRADKRFIFDNFTLDAYLEIVNTTLTREVFDVKRNLDGSLDERSFRIVLPSIGLHAEW